MITPASLISKWYDKKVKRFTALLTLLLIVTPLLAHADSVIFEFAPDSWQSQRFAMNTAAGPVYEIFQSPLTTTLTGLDLWVDNTGSSGPVTLTLFDASQQEIGIINASIPHLAQIAGGNKVHFEIQTPIPVITGETYSLQITSNLSGLGMYYADRILSIEHNRSFTSEYQNGVAKIGQNQQPFTFKLALYAPISQGAYNSDASSTIQAPSNSTSTIQEQENSIIITNARIVTSTPSTVTVAWTTNVATDARVGIRTQLNPLYTIAGNTDQTLELEHTVIVSGLQGATNYFADMFSSPGNQIVLTTYTIAFRTPAGSATPSTEPPTNPPPQDPPASTSTPPSTPPGNPPSNPPSNPPTDNNPGGTSNPPGTPSSTTPASTSTTPGGATGPGTSGSSNNPPDGSPGGSSSNPGINTNPGQGGGTNVSWPAAQGGGSQYGYRIDIFDQNHKLEKTITVPAGTTSKDIEGLADGTHTIIVYAANEDGTFIKVAPAKTVLLTPPTHTTAYIVTAGVVAAVAGGAWLAVRYFKKQKSVLPAEEGYDPEKS